MAFVYLEILPLKTNIILSSNETKLILLRKSKDPEASVLIFSLTLLENYLYSEVFWSVFSRNRTEYWEILRIHPNVRKYGPEKLRIRTPFTQCYMWKDRPWAEF